jgi:hypothetical protein
MLFFQFPEDGRWNDERDAVEFSVVLGPYEGNYALDVGDTKCSIHATGRRNNSGGVL